MEERPKRALPAVGVHLALRLPLAITAAVACQTRAARTEVAAAAESSVLQGGAPPHSPPSPLPSEQHFEARRAAKQTDALAFDGLRM